MSGLVEDADVGRPIEEQFDAVGRRIGPYLQGENGNGLVGYGTDTLIVVIGARIELPGVRGHVAEVARLQGGLIILDPGPGQSLVHGCAVHVLPGFAVGQPALGIPVLSDFAHGFPHVFFRVPDIIRAEFLLPGFRIGPFRAGLRRKTRSGKDHSGFQDRPVVLVHPLCLSGKDFDAVEIRKVLVEDAVTSTVIGVGIAEADNFAKEVEGGPFTGEDILVVVLEVVFHEACPVAVGDIPFGNDERVQEVGGGSVGPGFKTGFGDVIPLVGIPGHGKHIHEAPLGVGDESGVLERLPFGAVVVRFPLDADAVLGIGKDGAGERHRILHPAGVVVEPGPGGIQTQGVAGRRYGGGRCLAGMGEFHADGGAKAAVQQGVQRCLGGLCRGIGQETETGDKGKQKGFHD